MRLLAIASLAILMLAACSHASSAGVPFTPGSISAFAPPAAGNGAAVLSRSFVGATAVRAAYDPNGLVAAPNDAWIIVPGTLRVTFSHPLGTTSNASHFGLRVTMTYPKERSAQILTARATVVTARYANGSTLRWPAAGAFDAAHHRVVVDLPEGLLEHATSVTLALAIDRPAFKAEPPGPRYWDGKDWKMSGTIKANKNTVVLIHGLFSSVENAFPKGFFSSCPQTIANKQGFEQVLGFDYEWFEPPETEGKLFADFLKKIFDAKVSSLTIEAHSYGSLVTLAAIPKIPSSDSIANVVTMGGPLPLRGTPLAEKKNLWRLSMMFGLLDWYFDDPPSYVDRAFDSGMVASLATESNALQKILSEVKAMPNKPHFIQAAGTDWICFIPGITKCNYGEETFRKILIDGTGVKLPWDGVVETIAAESRDIPDAVATPFPLSHIELECNSDVIKWVAKQLK